MDITYDTEGQRLDLAGTFTIIGNVSSQKVPPHYDGGVCHFVVTDWPLLSSWALLSLGSGPVDGLHCGPII